MQGSNSPIGHLDTWAIGHCVCTSAVLRRSQGQRGKSGPGCSRATCSCVPGEAVSMQTAPTCQLWSILRRSSRRSFLCRYMAA
eukprot:365342-Chlamydomonas_euryale.AAC.10